MNQSSGSDGRVTVVVGGTGGLGTAIVRELLACGHRVAVIADAEAALTDVADLVAAGSIAHAIADVRDRAALEAAAHRFERTGFVANGIVANAGVVARDLLLDAPDSEIRRVLDTNLYGTIAALQVFAPATLASGRGRIVLTSSVTAIHATPRRASYIATKAGLLGLTRALSLEWGPQGTTVNAVAPGLIRTPLTADYFERFPDKGEAALLHTPLGRLGEPEDVARGVRFLLSDDASFITGQVLVIDGGISAGSDAW